MDILLNGVPVDVMATIVHRSKAYQVGKSLCQRLSEVNHRQVCNTYLHFTILSDLPLNIVYFRQLYEVAIQASIGYSAAISDNLCTQ